jgi:hypothetical protein
MMFAWHDHLASSRLGRLAAPTVVGLVTLALGAWQPAAAQTVSQRSRVASRADVGAPRAGGDRPHVVTVVTRDFAFEMPDTVPEGVTTFRLRNAGREPHHLMLYRLAAGRGMADVLAALRAGGAHPRWMQAVGGPNSVVGAMESVGTVRLGSGRYVAFCHVPSPDKVLHFEKGMLKLITVTPAHSAHLAAVGPGTRLPAADLVITLSDYAFHFSRAPKRGNQRIAITNRGRQPHELILSRLAPGKTSADFVRWIDTQKGAPPVEPYGGATDLSPGGTIVLDVDLAPGRYSAICRVRDTGDGQPHDRHGMTLDFVVP